MKTLLRTPWYYGWNIVVAGMATQAITLGIIIYSFTFWIAHWTEDFDVSRTEVMTVFLVVQVGSALFSPIAGRALDKFPVRYLILIAAASLAGGLALTAFATSFWQIIVIYSLLMVVGMVWAGVMPAATLVARWFDRRRGMAMGICTIGTSLGGFLLPPLVTYLQQEYGWRDANQMLAVLALAIISIAALVVFDSPEKAGLAHEGKADNGQKVADMQNSRQWTTQDALKSRIFWAIGLSFLFLSFSTNAVMQNLAPIGEDAGMAPTTLSWYVSTLALVMIFAKLGIGYLADRIDYRILLGTTLSLVASAVAILAIFGISEITLLCAVIALGVGMGGLLPMLGVIVANIFGLASFGRMQGLLILVMLPGSLGPVMAASVYDGTGSYQLAWIILLVLLAPAVLFIRGIRKVANPVGNV